MAVSPPKRRHPFACSYVTSPPCASGPLSTTKTVISSYLLLHFSTCRTNMETVAELCIQLGNNSATVSMFVRHLEKCNNK